MPRTNPRPSGDPQRPNTRSTRGQVPTGGQQTSDAPVVTLVHTPDLQVPHGRLAVSSLHQLQTHNGVAFVADLTLDGQFAGRIENDGNGGPTTYFGLGSSLFTWRHLHEYVQACRYRGRPVSEEFVLDALVDFTDRRKLHQRSGLCLCVPYMSTTDLPEGNAESHNEPVGPFADGYRSLSLLPACRWVRQTPVVEPSWAGLAPVGRNAWQFEQFGP